MAYLRDLTQSLRGPWKDGCQTRGWLITKTPGAALYLVLCKTPALNLASLWQMTTLQNLCMTDCLEVMNLIQSVKWTWLMLGGRKWMRHCKLMGAVWSRMESTTLGLQWWPRMGLLGHIHLTKELQLNVPSLLTLTQVLCWGKRQASHYIYW